MGFRAREPARRRRHSANRGEWSRVRQRRRPVGADRGDPLGRPRSNRAGDQRVRRQAPGGSAAAKRPATIWRSRYDPRVVNVPIRAGENQGRTIAHRNVVRSLSVLGRWKGAGRAPAAGGARPDPSLGDPRSERDRRTDHRRREALAKAYAASSFRLCRLRSCGSRKRLRMRMPWGSLRPARRPGCRRWPAPGSSAAAGSGGCLRPWDRGAEVGQLLGLQGIDLEVLRLGVLADHHALVEHSPGEMNSTPRSSSALSA